MFLRDVMFLCSLCVSVIILNFACWTGLWVAHKRSICSLGTTHRTTFTILCVFCFCILCVWRINLLDWLIDDWYSRESTTAAGWPLSLKELTLCPRRRHSTVSIHYYSRRRQVDLEQLPISAQRQRSAAALQSTSGGVKSKLHLYDLL